MEALIKRFVIWFSVTLFVYFLLALVMMFVRETTLHGVRAFDFDLIIESTKHFEENSYDEDFIELTNKLGLNVGKENEKIFFPLALVTANSCIDNGKTINLICEDIKNIDALNSLFASGKEYDYYNRGLHETSVGTFFKYEVDDNKILLGEAGSYLSIDKSFGSTLYLMKIFLKNDFHNYFLTWRGGDGKYGGVVKTWNKTKEVFFIVFTVSIILTLIGF